MGYIAMRYIANVLAHWVTISAISLVIPASTLQLYWSVICLIVLFVEQNKLMMNLLLKTYGN